MRMLAVLLMGLSLGCSKKTEPTPAPVASAPATVEPSTVKPEQPLPPDPATASAEPEKEKQPLSAYLSGAVAVVVSSVTLNPSGGATVKETQKLDEKATKAFLAKLDLTQKADGGVVRCPDDTIVAFRDAAGKALGSIGFCGDAARFAVPGGVAGGIKATKP